MIKVKNITKSFNTKPALSNISFELGGGEILGLIGANGAGKSTLLRILSTMLKPTSGEATICGYELGKSNSEIRSKIGILFGNEAGLYGNLTARENIEYFARLNGMSKPEAKARIDYLIAEFGMQAFADKRASQLSKGMKQKVAIARSIVHDPTIMLFDEPESGLDFYAANKIYDFVLKCKNEGRTVIFCSHSLEKVRNFSDKIIILQKSELVKTLNMHLLRQTSTTDEINNIIFSAIKDGGEN